MNNAESKLPPVILDRYVNLVNKLKNLSKVEKGQAASNFLNDIVVEFGLRQFYKDQSKLSTEIDSATDYDILEIIIAFSKGFETIESFYDYWRSITEEKNNKLGNDKTLMRSDIEFNTVVSLMEGTDVGLGANTSAGSSIDLNSEMYMNLDKSADSKDIHSQDKVKLSTIHKTKGNEYKNVAYFNLVSRITKKASESDIEDERRIAYVCVTRPINSLFITTQNNELSPFVGEFFLNPNYCNLSDKNLEKKLKNIHAESNIISSRLHAIDSQINKLSKKFPELNDTSIHPSDVKEAFTEFTLLQSVRRGMRDFDFDLALKKYTKLIVEKDNTDKKNLALINEIIDLGNELEYRKIIEQASCTR